ncbi:hypothetical protein HY732_01310 [Candidatus Uhrbacteria bacterium]|nr:hypothetical protein [Candidatus Uhrbacteria bacterium]
MKKKSTRRDDFYSFYSHSGQKEFPRPKRSRAPLVAAAVFAVLLSLSAWYGMIFFSNQRTGSETDPLTLTVTAPSQAVQGGSVEYAVHYENISDGSFPSAQLFLEYPENFTVLQTTPAATNEKKNFWNIGTLAPGTKGDIGIRGIYQQNASGTQTLRALLQYEHPSYRSSFFVKREHTLALGGTATPRIRIEGPSSLRTGEEFTETIRYGDLADYGDLDAVTLQLEMPKGFTVAEQTPAPVDSYTWSASSLQDSRDPLGGEGSIILKGTAENPDPGPQRIIARFVQKKTPTERITLFEQTAEISILGGDLALSLAADGQTQPRSIRFGATVPMTLSFQNTGTIIFRDVTITLSSKSPIVLLSKADAAGGKTSDDRIVWDKQSVALLDKIEPQAKGAISFSLHVEDRDVLEQLQFAEPNMAVALTVSAQSKKQETPDGIVTDTPLDMTGPTLTLPALSDARLDAFTKNGVTEESPAQGTVHVYWAIENTLHEINTIRVRAVLPKGIEWIGERSRSAGDVSYTAQSRTVAWTLNKLPASVRRIDSSFDVRILALPKNKAVLQDVRLTARDAVVSDDITQTIPLLTAP